MIKIAIVDDEEVMLRKITRIINEGFNQEKTIRTYNKSTDFFKDEDKFNFDIVFLDIDMPDITGFELAEVIKSVDSEITIIFVSNMEHLVFKAFEYQPFRFIRKDTADEDVISALNAYMKEIDSAKDYFIFQTNDYELKVLTNDIIYFESMGHDIYLKTATDYLKLKRSETKANNMQKLSQKFEAKGFVRVHKSYLLNCKYIFVINRTAVVLKNNDIIRINPHNVNEIKSKYQEYLMSEK